MSCRSRFKIAKGERVGIVGPNGAGKTTLFHLLCGILKPASGKMVINGREVVHGNFNPEVGFVFQNPDDQLFNATVFEDVTFGPLNLGLGRDEILKRAESALDITGTLKFRDRPPHHLSGGEKRMVAIATIIAMGPEVVIYDEPTSNLDMRSRRGLINFINLSSETTLISSHDLEFVLETCPRVILIDDGNIVIDGKSSEVMNDVKLMEEHGLERPHSLLHRGQHFHKSL